MTEERFRAHPPLEPPSWWACQHPERRPEYDRTRARHGCPACELVKTAAVANYAGEWETVA